MDTSQRVRGSISFVQAADSGSFAGAGRILGISSAAVSQNVAGLETALGVRLMNRTTRSLNLTEEGSAFLRQARIALDALEQATDDVVAARATPTGRVRISTSAHSCGSRPLDLSCLLSANNGCKAAKCFLAVNRDMGSSLAPD